MFKTLTALALVMTSLLATSVASAQDVDPDMENVPTVGVGTRLDTLLLNLGGLSGLGGLGSLSSTSAATIYVPINASPSLRLEPFLSHVSVVTKDNRDRIDRSQSTTGVGIGGFYAFGISRASRGYAGLRLGLNFTSDDTGTAKQSATLLLLAPTVGAELFFAQAWSVGADVSLSIQPTLSSDRVPDPSNLNRSTTTIATDAGLFLRFYLL
jgi:hypothetical protein